MVYNIHVVLKLALWAVLFSFCPLLIACSSEEKEKGNGSTCSRNDPASVPRVEYDSVVPVMTSIFSRHPMSEIYSLAANPDGTLLASGSKDNTAKLLQMRTERDLTDVRELEPDAGELHVLSGHEDSVHSVAFSPDCELLASGSRDGTVKLWQVSDGSEIRTLRKHGVGLATTGVLSVAFSPDGSVLASGGRDDKIKIWRVSDGSEIRSLDRHSDDVFSVAFSPDGTLLASGSKDTTVRLWRVSDGSEVRSLNGHRDDVFSVAFSPDGTLLASGSKDDRVRLWRVSDGREIRTLNYAADVQSIAFSPDGLYLVAAVKSRSTGVRIDPVSDGMTLLALSPEGKEGSEGCTGSCSALLSIDSKGTALVYDAGNNIIAFFW